MNSQLLQNITNIITCILVPATFIIALTTLIINWETIKTFIFKQKNKKINRIKYDLFGPGNEVPYTKELLNHYKKINKLLKKNIRQTNGNLNFANPYVYSCDKEWRISNITPEYIIFRQGIQFEFYFAIKNSKKDGLDLFEIKKHHIKMPSGLVHEIKKIKKINLIKESEIDSFFSLEKNLPQIRTGNIIVGVPTEHAKKIKDILLNCGFAERGV